MATPFPRTVRIGPHTWTITNDKKAWDKEDAKHEGNSHALTLCTKCRIVLSDKLKGQFLKVVLLHEVFHAAFSSSGGDLDASSEDTAEETFIQVTAPVMLGVLRDNPEFLAYLLD